MLRYTFVPALKSAAAPPATPAAKWNMWIVVVPSTILHCINVVAVASISLQNKLPVDLYDAEAVGANGNEFMTA